MSPLPPELAWFLIVPVVGLIELLERRMPISTALTTIAAGFLVLGAYAALDRFDHLVMPKRRRMFRVVFVYEALVLPPIFQHQGMTWFGFLLYPAIFFAVRALEEADDRYRRRRGLDVNPRRPLTLVADAPIDLPEPGDD